MAALWTNWCPRRVIAVRRSCKGLPDVLKAAELAVCSSRAASRGSAPTRVTILSGFVFDINSMPWPVQIITYAVAARYFVAILQSTFLAGDVWSVILPNAAALIAIAAIFLGAARALARKRLD